MGTMSADMSADDMAVRLARSARRFGSADSVEDLAELICEVAGELVEVADDVSVSLLERGGRITTVAATDNVCFAVDRFQEEHEEGPCVSAVREAPVTHLEDTSADPEWPAFSAWAAEHEVGSMMAIQLATYEGDEIDPTSGGEGQGGQKGRGATTRSEIHCISFRSLGMTTCRPLCPIRRQGAFIVAASLSRSCHLSTS